MLFNDKKMESGKAGVQERRRALDTFLPTPAGSASDRSGESHTHININTAPVVDDGGAGTDREVDDCFAGRGIYRPHCHFHSVLQRSVGHRGFWSETWNAPLLLARFPNLAALEYLIQHTSQLPSFHPNRYAKILSLSSSYAAFTGAMRS